MQDTIYTLWKAAGLVAFIYIMGTLGQVAGFAHSNGHLPGYYVEPLVD